MTRDETLINAVRAKDRVRAAEQQAAEERQTLGSAEREARLGRSAIDFPITVALGGNRFCTVSAERISGGRVGNFIYTFSTGLQA